MRVLIVEDEADLGEVFRDYIIACGHQAEVVGSAEAALEWLRTSRPHAIVLDVRLPGMSGLQLMRDSALRDSGIPVIVISGHATEHEARECLRLGALEFLAKPVPLEILGVVLERAELFNPADEGDGRGERRRARRFPVSLPVRMANEKGKVANGTVVEVSATGLRASLDTALKTGEAVRVSMTMPDQRGPLEVIALVVRTAPDGVAVWFLDLAPDETDRLLALAH
jgi:CheY-like chemotaxis protein